MAEPAPPSDHPFASAVRTWRNHHHSPAGPGGPYRVQGTLGAGEPVPGATAALLSQWAALLEQVRRLGGGRVLDVVGGDGRFGALCRELFGAEVVLVDPAPHPCRRAAEAFGLPGLCVDPANLPFPDDHFDLVTCSNALAFLTEPAQAFAEMCRVARRGVLVASSPECRPERDVIGQLLGAWQERVYGSDGGSLRRLLADAGGVEPAWLPLPAVGAGDLDPGELAPLLHRALAGDAEGQGAGGLAVLRLAPGQPLDIEPDRIVQALLRPGPPPYPVPETTAIVPLPDWLELQCKAASGREIFGTSGDLYTCLGCGDEFERNNGVMPISCRHLPPRPVHPLDAPYCKTPVWDLSRDGDGWVPFQHVEHLGGGRYRCPAGDPQLLSPLISVAPEACRQVRLRLRGRAADGAPRATVELFVLMEGELGFSDDLRLAFEVALDGQWHDHRIDVPPHPRLSRRLLRLRLDPINMPGEVEVAELELELALPAKAAEPAPAVERVRVHSHRRSGTHFLMETLRLNFDFEVCKGGHSLYRDVYHGERCFYVFRDGRDVLVSNYHWWKESGESESFGVLPRFQEVDFPAFLRGQADIALPHHRDVYGGAYLPRDYFRDPIGHWVEHVSGYLDRPEVHLVRFEDLKEDPERVVAEIAAARGKHVGSVRRQEELTGFHPRKGVVGGWRSYFDEDLLDYFWQKAGTLMERLGYERDPG